MKTFEGTFTIKWHKNCSGVARPLTIDAENEKELKEELNRIEAAYMVIGENGKPAYSVEFDMEEIKTEEGNYE